MVLFASVLALSVGGLSTPAQAAALVVTTIDDELNSDGDCSLREAIEAANVNAGVDACAAGDPAPGVDVITFSVAGTITLTSGALSITDDVTINGPGADTLTISGGKATSVLYVDPAERPTVDLTDINVVNGFSAGTGGAIFNGGTLTIHDTTFRRNSAYRGGAIENGSGRTLTIINTIFSRNTSGEFGGAIHNDGTLAVTGSAFFANSAVHGAAIMSFPSSTTVTGSTFSANTATLDGGGILAQGPLTVTETALSGNAGRNGGGILAVHASTITASSFFGNSATEQGGGIFNSGTLALVNSTLSGNTAGPGGGVANYGSMTVTNSTLSGDSAAYEGGEILNSYGGALTLENSIVANSLSGGNCFEREPITDGGGNLQHPGTECGATIPSADPLLDSAGFEDNGGPTETIALQSGSPAIDAALAGPCPDIDQRGIDRPQGPACDTGAFEVPNGVADNRVDPEALLRSTGRVNLSGAIFCGPPGDDFDIGVRVDQAATGAVTRVRHILGGCSGSDDGWAVTLRARSDSAAFVEGEATACWDAKTFDSVGTQTDRRKECGPVTLVAV